MTAENSTTKPHKKSGHKAMTISMPKDFRDFIHDAGLGKPSLGAQRLWNRVRKLKEVRKLLTDIE